MAAFLNQRTEGEGGARTYRRMAEINVTPFVDVMLVLLIVFMVTAPLLTVGVNVDLPQAQAPALQGQDEPLAVSVRADGEIFLQDTRVTLEDLAPRLRAITQNKPDTRIFVRGDQAIAYGRVMQVMGALNQAGFARVALVTQQPGTAAPAAPAPRR